MIDDKKKPLIQLEDEDSFLESGSVVSGTECTGMIPDLPNTEGAVESYQGIYSVPEQDESPRLVKKVREQRDGSAVRTDE
jgi:hypothetical protein